VAPLTGIDAFLWLALLALPVATVAWTVTHEEILRELRERCRTKSTASRTLAARKFFYVFTCEYCFSHYVAAAVVLATQYRVLFADWRGAVIGWFALVAVANVYMSLYARLRVDITSERLDVARKEQQSHVHLTLAGPRPGKDPT
jgi:hypothetical protein